MLPTLMIVEVSRRLAIVVLAMKYLPFVALAALVGYAFGWQIPVVFLALFGFLLYRGRRTGYRAVAVGKARALAGLGMAGLLGSVVGGLLFGGPGVIFGFAIGMALRLSEIPVTRTR